MARRGYKAPGNFDPRRSPKAKKQALGRAGADSDENAKRNKPQNRKIVAQNNDFVAYFSANPPLPGPLEATRTTPEDVAHLRFEDLGLGGNIVRALAELGATKPFAIQAATIPDALQGHHLLGRARPGSGKTIAFAAAVVERLLRLKAAGAFGAEAARPKAKRGERQQRPPQQAVRAPKALILAPTRELALQIDRTVQPIARSVGLFTGQFVGGQPFEPQLHALKRGVDIAIGTPGRIEDLAKRGHLGLGQIAITVIDEADHMAELGFIEALQRVLRLTPRGGQRMLFSATLDRGVDGVVKEFMPRPAIHEIDDVAGSATTNAATTSAAAMTASTETFDWSPQPNVEHRALIVLREHKDQALLQLVREGGRVIVFCRTRAYAAHVAELLAAAHLRVTSLHGDLSQARRELNLYSFTRGKADVLVATDVAARGIHVDDIDLVLQADPPDDPKAYVHRAGRTGRVGRAGRVLTVIPRTRQKRTRELFETLGFEPAYFGDFVPDGV
ncbi:MAG: DEAD/DEAH box helicase [Leucobacter sp.]|nr:DEAD/DEAH box helicase [Leucobacter sp.]